MSHCCLNEHRQESSWLCLSSFTVAKRKLENFIRRIGDKYVLAQSMLALPAVSVAGPNIAGTYKVGEAAVMT